MVCESISIAFLKDPCVYRKSDKECKGEMESRKEFFTQTAWNKMQMEGPGINICISHLRALQQGLDSGGGEEDSVQTELIVILEEDVVPEGDSAVLSIAILVVIFLATGTCRRQCWWV